MKKYLIFTTLFLTNISLFAQDWNWDEIKVNNLFFPSNFLWGSATAEFQNSGADTCKNSNWAKWEKSLDPCNNPRIAEGQVSKNAADHWNLYKEDISLMKDFGLNSYRFSIDWSVIEPEEGVFNQDAIDHYRDLIKELKVKGITLMATLHHFTHPSWFDDLGGFEKEENIKYFVRFSRLVFENFSSDIKLWCTINEPGIFSFMGYVLGRFSPGVFDFERGGVVLKNLLISHCKVYEALKKMPGGKEAQIGIVHNILKFEPYFWWNLIEALPSYVLSNITNNFVMDFLKTGKFCYNILFQAYVTLEMEKPPIDFIGLNYYSNPLLKTQFNICQPVCSSCYDKQEMSDYEFRLYPEGIYYAIKEISSLKVPIYITENGIPDKNDTKRKVFINRYLYAVSKAIQDGYDVKGYFYWTLTDNFEWQDGFLQKFGLYEVDFNTQKRTLRPGSMSYKKIIDDWKKNSFLKKTPTLFIEKSE